MSFGRFSRSAYCGSRFFIDKSHGQIQRTIIVVALFRWRRRDGLLCSGNHRPDRYCCPRGLARGRGLAPTDGTPAGTVLSIRLDLFGLVSLGTPLPICAGRFGSEESIRHTCNHLLRSCGIGYGFGRIFPGVGIVACLITASGSFNRALSRWKLGSQDLCGTVLFSRTNRCNNHGLHDFDHRKKLQPTRSIVPTEKPGVAFSDHKYRRE